jgi:ElaB/YqjD/DUF883 family membrane-anchored ribosome-binding protein
VAADGEIKPLRTQEEVRAEIERARAQIQSSVVALKHEVSLAADWREWVRRRPGLCLGAAFAIGLYLGYREW